jgi:hypothetical protein
VPSAFPQPVVHALASASAELASCVVLAPAEVIKQNAQMLQQSGAQRDGRSTSLRALHMIWRSDGGSWRRLLSGYTALAARNLPFTSIQFPLFEYIRGRLGGQRNQNRHQAAYSDTSSDGQLQSRTKAIKSRPERLVPALLETGLVTGASAAVSGGIAALITTPTDVVKTRMMLGAGSVSASAGSDNQNIHQKHHVRASGIQVAKAVFRRIFVHSGK